jgi:hypothetical protein
MIINHLLWTDRQRNHASDGSTTNSGGDTKGSSMCASTFQIRGNRDVTNINHILTVALFIIHAHGMISKLMTITTHYYVNDIVHSWVQHDGLIIEFYEGWKKKITKKHVYINCGTVTFEILVNYICILPMALNCKYMNACNIPGCEARNREETEVCIAFMHRKSGKFSRF